MKLIAIGIGGSGASCIEVLVHLTALGLLPEGAELIPVMVDPDQQHPRIQGTSRFIAAHARLRDVGAEASDGLLGTRISRVVGANALRPSDKANLFSLLGIAQPIARSIGTLFFSRDELGAPDSDEFDDGYYGRVNAGVCFFNDPTGRDDFMTALRQHVLGGDAAVVLIGSAFGGTGAAGLIHLARVFREDPQLQNVSFKLAAIQVEPYFRPDRHAGVVDDTELVNIPDTFEGRTGAAFQFLAGLAVNDNLPFDAIYPLGVRTPSSFPPEWFKRDQQNNPHLFIEYVAALAVRDFALNHRDLTTVIRHRREAVPPFEGPLAFLRECLYDATTLHALLRRFVVPLLESVPRSGSLPGHPWISSVCSTSGLRPPQLLEHVNAVSGLLADILVAAGVDRREAINRAGAANVERSAAERRVELTRQSFPAGLAPRAENFDAPELLQHANPEALFDSYAIARDGRLPVRALYRWIADALHPANGTGALPVIDRHVGETFHQWTQQGKDGAVLGIEVPPDDNFHSYRPAHYALRRLAQSPWRRPAGIERTAGEYPTIWAPALVHRDELYGGNASDDCRYLHLGLLACVLMVREQLGTAPVRLVRSQGLLEAFRRAMGSTFPLAGGHERLIAPGGILAIYESEEALGADNVPDASDVIGFFYPETVVVPAAGISPRNREHVIAIGRHAARKNIAGMLHALIANDWMQTLVESGVPNAEIVAERFIIFLNSFKAEPLVDVESLFVPGDRFESFPVAQAADWIHRLYR